MKKVYFLAMMPFMFGCNSVNFEKVYSSCGSPEGVSIVDDGKTMIIDGKGEEDSYGASTESLFCIIKGVKTPDYIVNGIETTRALDGKQMQEFNNITVSYSYHPNTGMNLSFHKK